jgi:hypothetical protein
MRRFPNLKNSKSKQKGLKNMRNYILVQSSIPTGGHSRVGGKYREDDPLLAPELFPSHLMACNEEQRPLQAPVLVDLMEEGKDGLRGPTNNGAEEDEQPLVMPSPF